MLEANCLEGLKSPTSSRQSPKVETIELQMDDQPIDLRTDGPSMEPQIDGQSMELQIDGQSMEPQIDGQSMEPQTDGQSMEPQTDGQSMEPQIDGQSMEPQIDGQSMEPQIDGQSMEPQTDGQSMEPQIDGQSMEPQIDGQSMESQIDGQSIEPQLAVGEYYEEDDNSRDRREIKAEVDPVEEPEMCEGHRDQKDIKIKEDTSSDTTEEWNPNIEVIDIKPMDLKLSSEIDSVEKLLRSSDHTDEETVNFHKLQLPYVDLSRSKVERVVNRKKKGRKKVSGDKWKITEEEEDWVPAKSKQPVRIVLTKRRLHVQDVSEEEEEGKITQTKVQAHSLIKDQSHSPFKEHNWVVCARREQDVD